MVAISHSSLFVSLGLAWVLQGSQRREKTIRDAVLLGRGPTGAQERLATLVRTAEERPVGERTVAIDLSLDEFVVLHQLAGFDVPPWVDATPVTDGPDEIREAVFAATQRSLQARQMLDESGAVAPPIRSLLQVLNSPELYISAIVAASSHPRGVIVADPSIAVHHAPFASMLHRLIAFPTEDLKARTRELTGLGDQPAAEGGSFDLDSQIILHAGRPGVDAPAVLRAGGASGSVADVFATGLRSGCGPQAAELAWLESAGRFRGAQVAWLDGGEVGMWGLSPEAVLDPQPGTVTVTPMSGSDLLDELLGGLPAVEPTES
jgi:hypothetical protein